MSSEIIQVVKTTQVAESISRKPPEIKKTVFGRFDLWRYNAVIDDVTCQSCKEMDAIGRFLGIHLRAQFPHLKIKDENTIVGDSPDDRGLTHPNCRCYLTRVTKWTDKDLEFIIAVVPY